MRARGLDQEKKGKEVGEEGRSGVEWIDRPQKTGSGEAERGTWVENYSMKEGERLGEG